MLKIFLIYLISLFIPVFTSVNCQASKFLAEVVLSGKTMGTTYHVTVVVPDQEDLEGFQKKIDTRLAEINQSMSTYLTHSEISRFNSLRAGKKFFISDDFHQVLSVAKTIYRLSDGAYDPTVNPLMKLWGFMSAKTDDRVPKKAEIEKTLSVVGLDRIIISGNGWVQKRVSDVQLDLASIAKGFGVDKVSELLLKNGFENFLVEIGGEIYAHGTRADGKPWRIGINTPEKGAPFNMVYKTISLSNMAIATSGDYRNFLFKDGKAVSHIIDPGTGYPVKNAVVSASIIAPNCTFADGLATALMVMGAAKGLNLINRLEHVEGLIITSEIDGSFKDHFSPAVAPD